MVPQDLDATTNKVSIMSAVEYTDAVHNFILTQKLTSLLGNFPEVMNNNLNIIFIDKMEGLEDDWVYAFVWISFSFVKILLFMK